MPNIENAVIPIANSLLYEISSNLVEISSDSRLSFRLNLSCRIFGHSAFSRVSYTLENENENENENDRKRIEDDSVIFKFSEFNKNSGFLRQKRA